MTLTRRQTLTSMSRLHFRDTLAGLTVAKRDRMNAELVY
jgi:hypothetical protein